MYCCVGLTTQEDFLSWEKRGEAKSEGKEGETKI